MNEPTRFAVKATSFLDGSGDYVHEDHPVYGWVTHPMRAKAHTFSAAISAQRLADHMNGQRRNEGVKVYTVVEV